MKSVKLKTNPKVALLFKNYPNTVSQKLLYLRRLILEVANDNDEITALEETVRWGEPSYLTKNGSTIRLDWKPHNPQEYAIYFNCSSRLVPTFKLLFKELFTFEGNRAIIFKMDSSIPTEELKYCINTALTYHKVKQLPFLGL
ncbi:DUF1801 domain-containing protein [Arenibacter certesii]|uniref:YdhG-like domain-containing protein n=1 Tax=Arenibacter certesii TaxID=228955 RepID=A0A918J3I9_9FLAO|nr:DUF1801 domain-containing protein [Arenibacter certesii]GGW44725.1 hypothetical protein GCM10007383_31410 [Arenibacter certesii]